jgi:tetratricopeptide (TPR) repeat protein
MTAAASLLANGVKLHQAGQLADAEMIYRQILAALPDQADCLHLLGLIFLQRGEHVLAVEHIDSALKNEHFRSQQSRVTVYGEDKKAVRCAGLCSFTFIVCKRRAFACAPAGPPLTHVKSSVRPSLSRRGSRFTEKTALHENASEPAAPGLPRTACAACA